LVLDSPAPLSFVEEEKIGANYQSSSSSSSSLNNSFISNYSKESVSSDTDFDKDEQTQDTQMFLNSPTSVEEFINALLPLIFKHRMNDASIKDQLKLFKPTLLSSNNCPKSVNAIYDFILKDREQYINLFYFCKTCQTFMTGRVQYM
jgi:hypothetical protein